MSKDIPIVVACWLAFAVIAVNLINMAAQWSATKHLIASQQREGEQ